MNIRRATTADTQDIAALHSASWRLTYNTVLSPTYLQDVVPSERREVWTQRMTSPASNQYVVVAEDRNGVAGFACVFSLAHEQWGSYLENLHVASSHQGQGLGRALLARVAQWCEGQVAGRGLYLTVNQANRRAQGFYLRLGARNAAESVWNAPDGSVVPTFRFAWDSAAPLAVGA